MSYLKLDWCNEASGALNAKGRTDILGYKQHTIYRDTIFDHAFLAVVNSRLKPVIVYVIVCKVSFDEPPPSPDLTAHIKGASQRAQTE